MKSLFKKFNILVFVLSFIIAVILWGYVSFYFNEIGDKMVTNIPVTFINEGNLNGTDLMIVSGRDSTVNVRFVGRLQDYSGLNENNLEAVVNLANVRAKGEVSLDYEIQSTELPMQLSSLEVFKLSPVVTVIIDTIERASVPFALETLPASAQDYIVGDARFDQPGVVVTGPSSLVSRLKKAVVDYAPPEEPISHAVSSAFTYTLHNEEGEISADEMALLTVPTDSVLMTIPVSMVKEVPLDISCINGGGITKENNLAIEYNPQTVRISGDPDILSGINSVMLATTLNLATLTEDLTETYPIQFPDNVTNIDTVTEAQVSIKIINAETRMITTTNITPVVNAANLPDGYQYVLRTTSLIVTIRGSSEDINSVQQYNIRVTADFGEEPLPTGLSKRPAVITVEGFMVDGVPMVGALDLGAEIWIDVVPIEPEDTGGDGS